MHRLVQKPLPLPPPQDKIWMATQHVIDDLHIVNHTRQRCHDLYNPKKVKEVVPEANLMCADLCISYLLFYFKQYMHFFDIKHVP